jgi:tetratricopeptide (TPR) repeat protein
MTFAKKIPLLLLCAGLAACASKASPEDVRMATALTVQGKALLSDGKSGEARDIYLSAIARDERNARAWNGLGVSYDLLGKRDKAQESYRRAVDLAPQDMTAANNLAHLYLEKGKPLEAFELLEPFANNKSAPMALKQNLARAAQLAEEKKPAVKEPVKETVKEPAKETAEEAAEDVYADIGSFPTDAMAQNHVAKVKALLDDDDISFLVVPEVKIMGGTPVFTVKAVGEDPRKICNKANPLAIPCDPHGKK